MNTYFLDKKDEIIKYGKYLILCVLLIVILLILKGCQNNHNDIEKKMVDAATKYMRNNNVYINDSIYLEISKLGEIEGTEMCKKASGVLVTLRDNKLNYKPYLLCDNYKSKLVNNKNNFITLNGDEVVILNKGEVYEEQNYTLKEDADVKIFGQVLKNPGVYTLTYNAYDDNKLMGSATRIVIVTENDKSQTVSNLTNKVEPTITLEGDKSIVLTVGEKYVEPGYKAVDYKDGKISREVKVEPKKIDTSRAGGPYKIRYTVTNSSGRTTVAERIVTVVNRKSNLNINLTSMASEIDNKVILTISVAGIGYNYMVLPNGKTSYKSTEIYEAKYNGTFTFKIYDSYGNMFTKEIDVNNIDSIPPSGTCNALVLGETTEVNVIATDNKGISGYKYILDNNETDFISDATYKANVSSKSVSVKVKDLAGNENNITCEVTVKTETVTRGTSSEDPTVIDTSEYVLVSAKNDTLKFAKLVDSKNVAQNHPPTYSGACLSFSYYHAYLLYNGDINEVNNMNAEAASHYKYAGKFEAFNRDDLQEVLIELYNQINAGKPVILHVNGNKEGTSRHYVTVVGYKASVKSGAELKGTDLLIIDSYDGKLERMDTATSRFIISGYDTGRTTYGYSLTIIK